jgi:DNA repair photolyase
LKDLLAAYGQLYLHFTVTGLGRTPVEPGVPDYRAALAQLPALIALAGDPLRVSVRFDPILFWKEDCRIRSNVDLFSEVAEASAAAGVRDIRVSFAQWYGKAARRAVARGFAFSVPSEEEQRTHTLELAAISAARGLVLHACCQPLLSGIPGIRPSDCIDGALLESLHPRLEPISRRKDPSQRESCLCTESKDIGSYTQRCPHACVYCYANPARSSPEPVSG